MARLLILLACAGQAGEEDHEQDSRQGTGEVGDVVHRDAPYQCRATPSLALHLGLQLRVHEVTDDGALHQLPQVEAQLCQYSHGEEAEDQEVPELAAEAPLRAARRARGLRRVRRRRRRRVLP